MREVAEFFSWLDLSQDGLEDVRSGVEANDFGKAGEALLGYFRSRENVHYYDGWEPPTEKMAFDTTKADAICRNHLVHVDLPEDIDWRVDPHGDPEWTYCLNRHEFLTGLGRAYWYTGDEKYTRAWKRLLGDWIQKNPMPDMEWMLISSSTRERRYWIPLSGIRLIAIIPYKNKCS